MRRGSDSHQVPLLDTELHVPDQRDQIYATTAACLIPPVQEKNTVNVPPSIRQRTLKVSHEALLFLILIVFLVTAVVDRFTNNVWPRQSFGDKCYWIFSTKRGCGFDRALSEFNGEPWPFWIYQFIAMISGRVIIVSSVGLYLTQLRCLWNFASENLTWIEWGDVRETNNKVHRYCGWTLAVFLLPHVWSIFLPGIVGYARTNIVNVKGPHVQFADLKTREMNLDRDDVYRFCMMTVIFLLGIPWSMSRTGQAKSYSMALHLHLLVTSIYTFDLFRRASHPHTWVVDAPFVLGYFIDRWVGVYYYRATDVEIVRKVRLDGNYLLLFLKGRREDSAEWGIGDVHWLKTKTSSNWEMGHPFTTWKNWQNAPIPTLEVGRNSWSGHKWQLVRKTEQNEEEEEEEGIHIEISKPIKKPNNTTPKTAELHRHTTLTSEEQEAANGWWTGGGRSQQQHQQHQQQHQPRQRYTWDTCAIMQVYPNRRGGCCLRKHPETNKIDSTDTTFLKCWGPYRTAFMRLKNIPCLPPLVLVASGAGGAYLIDFTMYIFSRQIHLQFPVYIFYTSRSLGLFQYITTMCCTYPIHNLTVNGHLTSHDEIEYNPTEKHPHREATVGRMSLVEIVQKADLATEVFFCGSPALQEKLRVMCSEKKLTFHGGHSFSSP